MMKFCVASTLEKGTDDFQSFEKLFNKFRHCCLLLSMCEANTVVERVTYLTKSESYLVPAGLELTDLEKKIIYIAGRMAKPVILFSHGEISDNQETVEYMRKKKIAKKPLPWAGKIFFKHLHYPYFK